MHESQPFHWCTTRTPPYRQNSLPAKTSDSKNTSHDGPPNPGMLHEHPQQQLPPSSMNANPLLSSFLLQCVKNVVLETTRDDGEIDRRTLQMDLVLRKEVGNARLVSGDAVLWVGNGVLSHKDSTVDSVPTRTVRIENRKRRFVFTVVLDAVGKQFYADLKDQVDAKARVEVRKKKRKIRTQLSRGTAVNTLKSPATGPSLLLPTPTKKLALTPKRAPLADIGTPQRTPQLALPPPLPVTLKESTPHLTSPLRSPFRSPFRKKARRSQSPSQGLVDLSSPSLRSPARVWLSTTQSLKLRSGSTSPDTGCLVRADSWGKRELKFNYSSHTIPMTHLVSFFACSRSMRT